MNRWQVILNNKVIGIAALDYISQPWFFCKFAPTAAFIEVANYFQTELEMLGAVDSDQWNDYYDQINSMGLKLISLSGEDDITELLTVHIQDKELWFRY